MGGLNSDVFSDLEFTCKNFVKKIPFIEIFSSKKFEI